MRSRIFNGSIIAAVIIIIAVILIKLYGSGSYSREITLPTPAGSGSSTVDGKTRLEVTPKTVQAVLKTLARASSFSRTYTVKSYWDGGESTSTLNVSQKASSTKITVSQNNTVKNILVLDNDVYVWYEGSTGVFKSKLTNSEASEADMFSRQITYEDIYDVDAGSITDAGYLEKSGQSCIFAEYKSGSLGYVKQLYVSIDSGLLVYSSIYDGDTLVYSMESVSTDLSTPSDDVFKVPST